MWHVQDTTIIYLYLQIGYVYLLYNCVLKSQLCNYCNMNVTIIRISDIAYIFSKDLLMSIYR